MPDNRRTHRARSRVIGARDLTGGPGTAFDQAPGAQHAVYYITSRWMGLLYIGQTSRLVDRLRAHASDKEWFDPSCRIFVEWYYDRAEAVLREANAIWEARPAHNLKVSLPNGTAAEPDVPLRPLVDLQRDIAGLCRDCGDRCVSGLNGVCSTCRARRTRAAAG